MVSASHCVGFTLPGMIELPGSFSGRISSPNPARGPEASQRISLAIFISAQAKVFSAPWANTMASWPASAADDVKIITAMKRGTDAVLTARSARGTQTKDSFSLLGFTAAIEDGEKRCSG